MATTGNRALMLGLAGVALLLAATSIAYRSAAPLGPDAPPGVFSASRAKAILQELVGDNVPHPIGSTANAHLREAIVERLTGLGYTSELQSGFVCTDDGVCGSPVNIIARLGAVPENQDAVLLAAHYDSVPAGPGASDDGAAVASALEIARILAARPRPPHPIVLLITDGEEAGLLGARLFVQRHPLARQVRAAVNLEARGTSGSSLMFETGTANSWLMHLYDSAITRPITNSLYYVIYKLLQNDTDFTVFKTAGYQGFNFAFIGHVGRYHTPLDNAANADARSIQQQGDDALTVLSALANSPTLRPPIAESVFFDGFARTLIVWPSASTPWAALLALALLLAETAILFRKRAVTGREIIWGAAGTLAALALGTALCAGLLALGLASGKVPPLAGASWIAHPAPMHVASAAIALFTAAGVSAWLARRAGFWGFWAAAALCEALLSVACALVMPGASFVFLLTAVAAGLGALPVAFSLARSRAPAGWAAGFAALLPMLVIFAAVFAQIQFLYMALGSLAWPVSTLVLGLGATTLMPLLAAATRRARQRIINAAVLSAAGGALLTFCLPTYSTEWPQRINLEYWWDSDTGEAHYLARCDSLRLPAALAAAARFDPSARPRFPGSAAPAFYAAAQKPLQRSMAAPELLLTAPPAPQGMASQAAGSLTHYTLRLRSARGAPEALVVFPASAQVGSVIFATAEGLVQAKLDRLQSGATLLDVVGLPAGGVEFSVDAAGRQPASIQVFDQSYAFPEEGQTLQRARPTNATSSQDGDLTVVHRTVSLDPAAGRAASNPTT
jgi:hypothetical protein